MALSTLKSFSPPPINLKEIARYAGQKGDDETINLVIEECLKEIADTLTFNVCYKRVECVVLGDEVLLGGRKIASKDLAKNLKDCKEAYLFGATIGLGIDRVIEKYSTIFPLKALIMHSIGVERIESLGDAFCAFLEKEVSKEGLSIRPRFSAGYGDFRIENQTLFFELLDNVKTIGLTLNSSLIMSPSKSVTAVVGISENGKVAKVGCEACSDKSCEYRR